MTQGQKVRPILLIVGIRQLEGDGELVLVDLNASDFRRDEFAQSLVRHSLNRIAKMYGQSVFHRRLDIRGRNAGDSDGGGFCVVGTVTLQTALDASRFSQIMPHDWDNRCWSSSQVCLWPKATGC